MRITAVYDPHAPTRDSLSRDVDAKPVSSLERVLADSEVEAVLVASPNHLHCEQTLAAAAAGKHVFCEKPMALSTADCDRMVAACRDAGVRLMVGQSTRLSPLVRRLRGVIEGGDLGDPVFGISTYLFPGFRQRETGVWHVERDLSGGLFFHMAIHQIDCFNAVFGPARRVHYAGGKHGSQVADFHDVASVLVEFASGATGVISAASISPVHSTDMRFICSRGFAHIDSPWTFLEYGPDAESMTHISAGDLSEPDPYELELGSFARWVLHDEAPLLTAAEGRSAVAVAEAAQEAERTGQPAAVPGG
jgi:myo-inositol 2-dehydrogenase/D-chiro-inositol 1-dehydrogenase